MDELTFRPCKQGHLALIAPHEAFGPVQPLYLSPQFAELLNDNVGLSAWAGNHCVGAAGVIAIHKYRFLAWSFLSVNSGPFMLGITRKTKEVLDSFKDVRVEMAVNVDFKEGHRWAKLLGFQMEAPFMKCYGYLKEDQSLYSRFRSS